MSITIQHDGDFRHYCDDHGMEQAWTDVENIMNSRQERASLRLLHWFHINRYGDGGHRCTPWDNFQVRRYYCDPANFRPGVRRAREFVLARMNNDGFCVTEDADLDDYAPNSDQTYEIVCEYDGCTDVLREAYQYCSECDREVSADAFAVAGVDICNEHGPNYVVVRDGTHIAYLGTYGEDDRYPMWTYWHEAEGNWRYQAGCQDHNFKGAMEHWCNRSHSEPERAIAMAEAVFTHYMQNCTIAPINPTFRETT